MTRAQPREAMAAAQLGASGLPSGRDLSVFINCPYDAEYQHTFDAIIFTVLCCGFEPRSARETDTTSDSRMQRIMASLQASRFSIHDLSRCRGEGTANLARFNMPFELGIAMGMKQASEGGATARLHDWTALVPEGVGYQAVISDLNGHDLKRYATREALVAKIMAWLVTRFPYMPMALTPDRVIDALPDFDTALAALRKKWLGAEPWPEIIADGQKVARRSRLIPKPKAAAP